MSYMLSLSRDSITNGRSVNGNGSNNGNGSGATNSNHGYYGSANESEAGIRSANANANASSVGDHLRHNGDYVYKTNRPNNRETSYLFNPHSGERGAVFVRNETNDDHGDDNRGNSGIRDNNNNNSTNNNNISSNIGANSGYTSQNNNNDNEGIRVVGYDSPDYQTTNENQPRTANDLRSDSARVTGPHYSWMGVARTYVQDGSTPSRQINVWTNQARNQTLAYCSTLEESSTIFAAELSLSKVLGLNIVCNRDKSIVAISISDGGFHMVFHASRACLSDNFGRMEAPEWLSRVLKNAEVTKIVCDESARAKLERDFGTRCLGFWDLQRHVRMFERQVISPDFPLSLAGMYERECGGQLRRDLQHVEWPTTTAMSADYAIYTAVNALACVMVYHSLLDRYAGKQQARSSAVPTAQTQSSRPQPSSSSSSSLLSTLPMAAAAVAASTATTPPVSYLPPSATHQHQHQHQHQRDQDYQDDQPSNFVGAQYASSEAHFGGVASNSAMEFEYSAERNRARDHDHDSYYRGEHRDGNYVYVKQELPIHDYSKGNSVEISSSMIVSFLNSVREKGMAIPTERIKLVNLIANSLSELNRLPMSIEEKRIIAGRALDNMSRNTTKR